METLQTALLQAGVAGVVLGWFMLRAEKKWDEQTEAMTRTEAAIDRLAKAQLMLLIASDSTPPSVRQLAQDLSNEVDAAEDRRRPSPAARSGPRR